MGTKLRNISTNTVTKTIAFVLVVILITASMVQLIDGVELNINPESLLFENYKDSRDFYYQVDNAFYETISFLRRDIAMVEGSMVGKNFYYYISDGYNRNFSNVENTDREFFAQNKEAFYAFENGEWSFGENTNSTRVPNHYTIPEGDTTIYIAFPDEFIEEKQLEWQENRGALIPYVIGITICLALALILIIYLMIVTGRRPEDRQLLHLSRLDSIYSDLLVFVLIPIGGIWALTMAESFNGIGSIYQAMDMGEVFYFILVGGVTAITTILCLSILLSLVRKFKAKMLIKHSLIYQFFYKIYDFIKSLFDGRRFEKYPLTKALFYRQLLFILTSFGLVFITFLFLFIGLPFVFIPPILEVVVIYWYVKYNNKTFEEINAGFNESLEEQMKSERMKVALITNVSHDLKTPLTSIISYIDLLSKEEDLSESARDYVNILSDKSNRLKQIVSDLFDLAKSTSGDIHLDLETLDIKKLIEQTLGDMEDKIEQSGFQIKTNLPEKSINIRSDGKRLYRVFQNIIDNALKYSLEGTRIYVDLKENNGQAVATIKNIAGYEMDFTEEEILQRFNRGDKSRSTDGSGLGLSIAQSFTNVCGGDFMIDIDGDLFKVMISFPIVFMD